MMLETDGYEVIALNEGTHIKKRIQECSPALVILDVWMPGMDGREITRMLKTNKDTREIPVILISALADLREIAQEVGANDFIAKPFDIEHFLQVVQRHITSPF